MEEELRLSLGRALFWCNTDYCDVKCTIYYLLFVVKTQSVARTVRSMARKAFSEPGLQGEGMEVR